MYILITAKKGISSVQLATHLGCTQKTSWFLAHRIRKSWEQNKDKLEGTVEIDECYIGGKEGNRHMKDRIKGKKDKNVVLGMIERESKQIKVIKINNAKTNIIHSQVVDNIEKNSN